MRHGLSGRLRAENFGIRSAGMPDHDAIADRQREKARTRLRAHRRHEGGGHRLVEVRSTVIVCRARGALVPRRLDPQSCPECGAGS